MKKKKIQWRELIGEIVGELVIYLIFFGLGALVMGWFGVDIDADNVDGDLLCLVGIGVFAVLGGVVWVAEILKKKKKASDKSDENADNNDSRF